VFIVLGDFMVDIDMMTTPIPFEYKIVKNLGLVTGITCRTRGVGGKFVAGFQEIAGGEVSAFTSEIDKARFQAIDRMKEKAVKLGANLIAGVDVETSDILSSIIISVTGTALIVERKK